MSSPDTSQIETDNINETDRIVRVCSVVLRREHENLQLLTFEHDMLGKQVVIGTPQEDEQLWQSASRALVSQAGVETLNRPLSLGKSDGIVRGESWHFMLCTTEPLAHEWQFTITDPDNQGPDTFSYSWQDFAKFFDDDWDAAVVRAIRYIELKVSAMSPERIDALVPPQNQPVSDAILKSLEQNSSIDPTQVARDLAGTDEKQWRKLMKAIRTEALRLSASGKVSILRKGKPIDNPNFKGLYRIARKD